MSWRRGHWDLWESMWCPRRMTRGILPEKTGLLQVGLDPQGLVCLPWLGHWVWHNYGVAGSRSRPERRGPCGFRRQWGEDGFLAEREG